MIKHNEALERILSTHAACLGADLPGYRNHVYRVINLCGLLTPLNPVQLDKVVIAAAFHDLGIWTANTFDYLPPSRRLAEVYLKEHDQQAWLPEIVAMIDDHHKLGAASHAPHHLPEVFRRADLIDLSLGLFGFGVERRKVREVRATFANAGFHRRLASHPCDPLPMFKR
ncbi:hypothetical protein [Pseudomonas putida]